MSIRVHPQLVHLEAAVVVAQDWRRQVTEDQEPVTKVTLVEMESAAVVS
jgi:hypothetical protein